MSAAAAAHGLDERDDALAARRSILVVDSRPTDSWPLRDIVANLGAHGVRVVLAGTLAEAVASVKATPHASALIHVGLCATSTEIGAGTSVAREIDRDAPGLPYILYTGRPRAAAEAAKESWRAVRWILSERALSSRSSLRDVLASRIDLGRASALLAGRCRGLAAGRQNAEPLLPTDFAIDALLPAVRDALTIAAARACAGHPAGAAALSLPERTYRNWLAALPKPPPRPSWPDAHPVVVWISCGEAPPELAQAAAASGAEIFPLRPGALHPEDVADARLLAALVDVRTTARGREPEIGSTAVDAWLLEASSPPVPHVLVGPPSAPMAFLLSGMDLAEPCLDLDQVPAVVGELLTAGSGTLRFQRVVDGYRCPPDPKLSLPPWTVVARELLARVEADHLFLADSTHATKRAAAAAVGLARHTFVRRLSWARRRFPST